MFVAFWSFKLCETTKVLVFLLIFFCGTIAVAARTQCNSVFKACWRLWLWYTCFPYVSWACAARESYIKKLISIHLLDLDFTKFQDPRNPIVTTVRLVLAVGLIGVGAIFGVEPMMRLYPVSGPCWTHFDPKFDLFDVFFTWLMWGEGCEPSQIDPKLNSNIDLGPTRILTWPNASSLQHFRQTNCKDTEHQPKVGSIWAFWEHKHPNWHTLTVATGKR